MSTEFISFQPPPGDLIRDYDRKLPSSEQPEHIPTHFCEAMSIREEVFVHEQKVPLENELDEDDPRSWHWVTYVSVGNNNSSAASTESSSKPSGTKLRKGSTASRIAAATIRLVPPPHDPHPPPGSHNSIDARPSKSHSRDTSTSSAGDPHSKFNAENEPYIKLGRLSTLQPFRKLGLGRLLVETALEWASAHPDEILPPPSATDREAARAETMDDEEWAKEWEKQKWRGLVLVHAQLSVVEWYKKLGFVVDEGLGQWDEEGIIHMGLWKRVGIKDKRDK